MEHLIKILFLSQGRSKLDKADFYKIFSKLLPSGQLYQTQYNINNVNNLNNNINSQSIQDSQVPVKDEMSKTENKPSINVNNTSLNQLNQTNIKDKDKTNRTRKFEEIGELVAKYKLKRGKSKSEAVDIFKDIFDKDASLGIDKKELAIGFEKMGIILTDTERNNLWKKMTNNIGNIDFASFKAFHDKYCLVPVQSNDNTMRSIAANNSINSGASMPNSPH